MKRALLLTIPLLVLSGCYTESFKEYKEENPNYREDYREFKIVGQAQIPTAFYVRIVDIVEDVEKGCRYMVDTVQGDPLTMTPLFDSDGKIEGCREKNDRKESE